MKSNVSRRNFLKLAAGTAASLAFMPHAQGLEGLVGPTGQPVPVNTIEKVLSDTIPGRPDLPDFPWGMTPYQEDYVNNTQVHTNWEEMIKNDKLAEIQDSQDFISGRRMVFNVPPGTKFYELLFLTEGLVRSYTVPVQVHGSGGLVTKDMSGNSVVAFTTTLEQFPIGVPATTDQRMLHNDIRILRVTKRDAIKYGFKPYEFQEYVDAAERGEANSLWITHNLSPLPVVSGYRNGGFVYLHLKDCRYITYDELSQLAGMDKKAGTLSYNSKTGEILAGPGELIFVKPGKATVMQSYDQTWNVVTATQSGGTYTINATPTSSLNVLAYNRDGRWVFFAGKELIQSDVFYENGRWKTVVPTTNQTPEQMLSVRLQSRARVSKAFADKLAKLAFRTKEYVESYPLEHNYNGLHTFSGMVPIVGMPTGITGLVMPNTAYFGGYKLELSPVFVP